MKKQLDKSIKLVKQWYLKKNFDNMVTIPLLILLAVSLVAQSSVAGGEHFTKHLIYILLGIPVFYLGYSLHPEMLRRFSWIFYAFAILLLIWVSIKGTTSLGAQRWITIFGFSMQPAEPAKLACILALGSWYQKNPPQKLTDLIIAGCAVMLLPFTLIFLQPDLGTSLVLVVIYFAITYWAGAHLIELLVIFNPGIIVLMSAIGLKYGLSFGELNLLGHDISIASSYLGIAYIIFSIALIYKHYRIRHKKWIKPLILIYLIFCLAIAFVGRPLAWDTLEPYQQMRLTIFTNPDADPQGAGYNIIQSLLAVGSGGLIGQGYQRGQLTQGNFVPEQHTDFIFSSLAEEWGIAGCLIMLICFGLICHRLVVYSSKTKEPFERTMIIGILTFLFFHMAVNMGMNIGLLPITGVPLPLMSYGGTAIWITLLSLGITQRIHAMRFKNPSRYMGNY